MTNEVLFTDKKAVELRNEYINRTEVLDKVKTLFLIPELEVMTASQVAEFYGVEVETVKKCYQRNKGEIFADGIVLITYKFLKRQNVPIRNTNQMNGKYCIEFENGVRLVLPNRGATGFSKRAILRIGMLLRDSEIAKEVRTQLLNTFENATYEVQISEVDEELAIQKEIGEAYMAGDIQKLLEATVKATAYKNRHIEALNRDNDKLKKDNDNLTLVNEGLTKEALRWNNTKMLNKAIRLIASARRMSYPQQWNEFYDELLYKHGIALKNRGCKTPIKAIRDNEWDCIWQTITAICESRYLNTADILRRAKIVDEEESEE